MTMHGHEHFIYILVYVRGILVGYTFYKVSMKLLFKSDSNIHVCPDHHPDFYVMYL